MSDVARVTSPSAFDKRAEREFRLAHALSETYGMKLMSDTDPLALLRTTSLQQLLEVVDQLVGSKQSETYLTAKQKDHSSLVDWIEQWLETADWWPEESFNYGCE